MAITLDENALVTEAQVKSYLGITGSDHDAVLELLINQVCGMANAYTDRNLSYRTYTDEYIDGNGEQVLELPFWPVNADETFTVEEDGTELTEGEDEDYLLYAGDGYLHKIGATWYKGAKAIKITTAKAGYDPASSGATPAVPADFRVSILKQISHEWHIQKNKLAGQENRSLPDGGSVSVASEDIIKAVELVWMRYRKI